MHVSLCYVIVYLALEVIFKGITGSPFHPGTPMGLAAAVVLGLLFAYLHSFFRPAVQKVLFYINTAVITLFFMMQNCLHAQFGFYFSLALIRNTGQIMDFGRDILTLIGREALHLILLALPLLLFALLHSHIRFPQKKEEKRVPLIVALVLLLLVGIGWHNQKRDYNEPFNDRYVEKLGVLPSLMLNGWRTLSGYETEIEVVPTEEEAENDHKKTEKPKGWNVLSIDLKSKIAEEQNDSIRRMHEYFNSRQATEKNDHTGIFAGKNLIVFLAESFNALAVREDTTPTLYRLIHEGYHFTNFYSPHILSTIGGEYQLLTASVPSEGGLSGLQGGTNSYPFGLGTMFKNEGYSVYAYHDNSYTFQKRDAYLASMGFDNYKGCGNGMVETACEGWPESDIAMIEGTTEDYIHDDQFLAYYVTVSGHGPYSFSKYANSIAPKYKDIIDGLGLEIDEPTGAYLAANIELDRALELLLERLEEAGRLEDTVIALVGDHYPYYLNWEEICSLTGEKTDMTIDVHHSNFILYNSATPTETVTKVGSQIDVLPTLYNLFGLPYDSRLMIGRDIFSSAPGLAIFYDRSWVSDKGKYYSYPGEFVPNDGAVYAESYVEETDRKVQNEAAISLLMSQKDYYKYLSTGE